MNVLLFDQISGENVVLPGLAPHHTRGSFGSESRLYVENVAPDADSFIRVEDTGLWLLPAVVAERDRRAGEAKMAKSAERQQEAGMPHEADRSIKGSRIMARTAITSTGCMVKGLRNQNVFAWAHAFAERELRTFSLDDVSDMPYLRVCAEDDCYNPRHFDIDFGRPTLQERKVEVVPELYSTMSDGRIQTIWGDILPSLEESMAYYIEFQNSNYPFVPYKSSRLTASGVSHVRFQPITGCWESWTYYCKPEDNLHWQFDGYGRLYYKFKERTLDPETGELVESGRRGHWMAHRVIWQATGHKLEPGMVLNHLCSYRRCCNPLHLEQVSSSENTLHGGRVQQAMRKRNVGDATDTGAKAMLDHHKKAQELYRKLAA